MTEWVMIAWVLSVVFFYSIVQSVFGMGLLVFGTPSLLLMGLGFTESLGYLLPASIALSTIQIMGRRRPPGLISPNLWYFCVPMICMGLTLSIFASGDFPINRIVGVVLIMSVAGAAVPRFREGLVRAVRRYSWPYHMAMGFIHGLSNMGGSLLSVYATSMSDYKSDTRYVVAYYYLVFSAWQILLLLVAGQLDFSYNLVTPVISVAVYLVLGKRAFRSASEPAYRSLFMAFMAAYGTALLIV